MQITRHSLIGIIFTGLCVLGIFLYFINRPYIDIPKDGTAVIAFGDSLVAGVGATEGNDLISKIEQQTGATIINAGKSGDTTSAALLRFEEDVPVHDPKIVIILLGGNDALRRTGREQTFQNLSTMIDRIHAEGAGVLLLGVRGGIVNGGYEEEFKKLAKEKRVSYVSDVLKGILGHPELMADAIHPNDRGYAIIADRIVPILSKMLENY